MSGDLEWVVGYKQQVGSSGYNYNNHNYSQCGESSITNMCGNNYYVNVKGALTNYSVCDKKIDQASCVSIGGCTAKGTCLDYKLCPNIGQIQSQAQWSYKNNGNYGLNDSIGSKSEISCLYPLVTFSDLNSVIEFKNNFGVNDSYVNQILPYYCSTQTNTCPIDPGTKLPMKNCSRFVSIDQADTICSGFLSILREREEFTKIDDVFNDYCRTFNTPDCDCINRANNPVYQIMSVGQNALNDSCWWSPCKSSDIGSAKTYLVPYSISPCTADNFVICNNVNTVIGGESQNLSFNASNYTTCELTDNNNPGSDGGGEGNKDKESSNVIKEYWYIFLIAIIIIVVVIILLIVL